MHTYSRFNYAVRVLNLFVMAGNRQLTFEAIAGNLNIDQTEIWHILVELQNAGLVVASKEPRQGFLLARDADSLTMWEILQAVEERSLRSIMRPYLQDLAPRYEPSVRALMQNMTLSEMVSVMQRYAERNSRRFWH